MIAITSKITAEQAALIRGSPLFFVASGSIDLSPGPNGEGPINLSPKGGSPLHVIGNDRVAYLDYTGSGNETARHATTGGPITVMVCSFSERDAAIVRLFGHARVFAVEDYEFSELLLGTPAGNIALPQRQIVDIKVENAVTSCGYGVPVMEYVSERTRGNRGRKFKQGSSSRKTRNRKAK